LIPELILFALLLGWITGGKFSRLADAKIRFGWMIFLPLALYLICWLPPFLKLTWFARTTNVIERAALITVGIANWRLPGVKLMVVGLILNAIAIVANGGLMPADPQALAAAFGDEYLRHAMTATHVRSAIMDTSTELGFLCDIIAAKRPFVAIPAVYSIGDLVMSVGIFIAIISIMRTPQPRDRAADVSSPVEKKGAKREEVRA